MSKSHYLNLIRYFTAMTLIVLVGSFATLGCTGRRNATMSTFDDPVVETGPTTPYRYSSSKQDNMNLKPLFDDKCVSCHNIELQPKIPLTTYLEVYSRRVLVQRAVKPGGAMEKYSGTESSKIMNWYDGNCPE